MPEQNSHNMSSADLIELKAQIKEWALELGFQQLGVSDIDLGQHRQFLQQWLDRHFHGEMHYMHRHLDKRFYPEKLVPQTLRVLSVRLNYLPDQVPLQKRLSTPKQAYISRYALGRDYHKMMRKRLAKLATQIEHKIGPFGYRAFVDSAPVLEKALAEKAGLGWIGKNTLLINQKIGSWFFLGELFTDLPLPIDQMASAHCGSCSACIEICPTKAIVAPYQLDARRCISYLTIEHAGSIPTELRAAMGNRVFGCDDCQIICPWNKFAQPTRESDFTPRHQLDSATLVTLFNWDESTFMQKTEGSAIRRTGYSGWLRNLAIGLGNAPYSETILTALHNKKPSCNELVQEHINWAILMQVSKKEKK